MIDSVVFDMDGVLLDTEKICVDAWLLTAEEMNMDNIEDVVLGCIGLNKQDTIRYFLERYGASFPCEEAMKRTSEFYQDIIKRDGIALKPGVFEILTCLKNRGYKIGLATSTGRRGVENHLGKAGILSYFETMVTGDMVKHSKPNPEIYQIACRELNAAPENCVAIEDSFNGIHAAFHAGMKPVMVPDLLEPSEEIEKLLYRKYKSLLEVRELFVPSEG